MLSIEELVDQFVRAGVLLRPAEPEGVTLGAARPRLLRQKRFCHVFRDGDIEQLTLGAPIADLLVLQEQAVQKALEGITLRTLVSDSQVR